MMYFDASATGGSVIEMIHAHVADEFVSPLNSVYGDFASVTQRLWVLANGIGVQLPEPALQSAMRNAYASMLRSWRDFAKNNRTGFDTLWNTTAHGVMSRVGRFPSPAVDGVANEVHDAYAYCYYGQHLPFYLCQGYLKAIRDHDDIAECVVHPYRSVRGCIRLYMTRYHGHTAQGRAIADAADTFVNVLEKTPTPNQYRGDRG